MGWKGCWTGFSKSVESFVPAMWSGRGGCIGFYSCVGFPCVSIAVLAASNTTRSRAQLLPGCCEHLCVCDLTSTVGVSLLNDLPVCSKYCNIRRVAVDVTQRHVVSHGHRQEEGHKGALCNISLRRHVAKVLSSTNYGFNCKVELRIDAEA